MKLQEITLSKDILDILRDQGITEFYPPQAEALPAALQGENLVLSVPTAAGKSLVAYLAILHRLSHEKGKALYVVPLRALAREKYDDLKAFEKLGFKVGLATGDLDESDSHLSRYDIIVCTSEKADSLLRHGITWLDKLIVLIIDEIHLIHDPSRGPTLEVIIARFKALNPRTQIIALSATIQNAEELATWLKGKLITSDWRPVPLKEGVCFRNTITYGDGSVKTLKGSAGKPIEKLVQDSLLDGGQVLIFVNNRRSTVSLAKKLSMITSTMLSADEKKDIKKVLTALKRDPAEHTSVGQLLYECVHDGVAFHHAGLTSHQRRTVEQGFKDHLIKCIVATPTLAAGVNIPARRVLIRDLWRYDPECGMIPIPILEYKQQAGRAGRPRYDTIGEAITLATTPEQQEKILQTYICADTEPIYSKLGAQTALRMHLLAAIATQFATTNERIYSFINSTFYAYQSDIDTLKGDIATAITFLQEHEFIEPTGKDYRATLFGLRTSSLYIDPLSAIQLKTALEQSSTRRITSISYLQAISATPDIPSLYLRAEDTWVEEKAIALQSSLFIEFPEPSSPEYERFLSTIKTALLLEDWISEVPEDVLITKYSIGPGDIHTIVESAKWLLHAMREFARMYNFGLVSEINDLVLRIQNGCKKELLNLISLRGIGRVRARALYTEGFKTVNDLRDVPIERLARIKTIGKGVATSIKIQLGEEGQRTYKELRHYAQRPK